MKKLPVILLIIFLTALVVSGVAGWFYWFQFRPAQVLATCTEQAQSRQDKHIEGNKPTAYRDYLIKTYSYNDEQIKGVDAQIEAWEKTNDKSISGSFTFVEQNTLNLSYLSDLKKNVPERTVYKPASKEDKNTFYRECLSKGGLKPVSLYEKGT